MSNTYLLQDHCFKIEGDDLKIFDNDGVEVESITILNNLASISISQDGTEATIISAEEYIYRHDFNLDHSEFCMDGHTTDDKPIAMIIGEINIECPVRSTNGGEEAEDEEPYFGIAKAGETFGLEISEIQGARVLQVHRNQSEIDCGCIVKPDCYS